MDLPPPLTPRSVRIFDRRARDAPPRDVLESYRRVHPRPPLLREGAVRVQNLQQIRGIEFFKWANKRKLSATPPNLVPAPVGPRQCPEDPPPVEPTAGLSASSEVF